MVGLLSPLVENAADPSNPTEAVPLTRRLAELFPHLYIELAYHHHPREKLINRGLVALAQRLDLPLVATNAVRFARKQDALTSSVLEAIGRRRRAVGIVGSADGDESDVPVVSVDDAYRAQAYLKSPNEMNRLFAQLPAALSATAPSTRHRQQNIGGRSTQLKNRPACSRPECTISQTNRRAQAATTGWFPTAASTRALSAAFIALKPRSVWSSRFRANSGTSTPVKRSCCTNRTRPGPSGWISN